MVGALLGAHATHHKPGCKTRVCDVRVDRAWAIAHRPPFQATPFELCVAGHESGAGVVVTPANADSYRADIRWNYDDGEYEGGFNWRHSTWSWQAADTPRVHAAYAKEATEEEQVLVFRKHENAGEWPQSVPACGG